MQDHVPKQGEDEMLAVVDGVSDGDGTVIDGVAEMLGEDEATAVTLGEALVDTDELAEGDTDTEVLGEDEDEIDLLDEGDAERVRAFEEETEVVGAKEGDGDEDNNTTGLAREKERG